MRDQTDEFAAIRRRSSTPRTVPIDVFFAPLSVLLIASVFGAFGQAAATVSFILAEALVLYVGYGVLTSVVSPAVRETLVGD